MPVLGCGAEMAKLMDVSDQDVQTIEDVIKERIEMGISQAQAQRQAVNEALAQLAEERSMVMKAIDEQLGREEVKPVAAPAKQSASTKRKPAFTVAQARAVIDKRHAKIMEGLERKGLVTLVQTQDDAITAAAQARSDKTGEDVESIKRSMMGGVDIKRSANGAIEGFYDPETGKAFLIADGLTSRTTVGTLMHEVGIHMAADGSMVPVFARALKLLQNGRNDPFMRKVGQRMRDAGESTGEEAAAYIVTEYENDPDNAPDMVKNWVTNLYATIRAWMFRQGIIITADHLTPADIHAVAAANVKALAKGADAYTKGDVSLSHKVRSLWEKYADSGDAFKFGNTEAQRSKDIAELAQAFSGDGVELEGRIEENGSVHVNVKNDPDRFMTLYTYPPAATWKVNAQDARAMRSSNGADGSAGQRMYQSLFAYAYNNGMKVKADFDLTPVNALRRTASMLSSGLRSGSLEHLIDAHELQHVEGYNPADFGSSIRKLAEAELRMVTSRIPGLSSLSINSNSGAVYVDQSSGGMADALFRGHQIESLDSRLAFEQSGRVGSEDRRGNASEVGREGAKTGQGDSRLNNGGAQGDVVDASRATGAESEALAGHEKSIVSDSELARYLASVGGGFDSHGVGVSTLKRALITRDHAGTDVPGLLYSGKGQLLAPNGKPSKLTPGQHAQVRTPQFKAWFGDWENDPENASKAVDENGEPLVVYHGTTKSFDAFSNGTGWFTSDPGEANFWGGVNADGANVVPAYLSIKNPRVLQASEASRNKINDALEALHGDEDGVLVMEDGRIRWAVVAEPTQIKSATGNNGQFDPKNPDIRFSRGTSESMTNNDVVGNQGGRSADDSTRGTDESTGLPLNADGTVTVYHHTSKANADSIRKTGVLKSQAEPDVYVTTRRETDTGYGDTAVPIRVDPEKLSIDDEFPDGRKDFRLSVGKPGGSIKVTVSNESTAPDSGGAPLRFSRAAPTTQPATWALESKTGDSFIQKYQDGRVDLKRAQQSIESFTGQEIPETADARLAETLYAGRVADRAQAFMRGDVKPLMELMHKQGIDQLELSDYMLARHAPERNAQIAKVNPDMPDGGAGTNSKGVLMTTQAAKDYMANLSAGQRIKLDLIAKQVDAITQGTRQLLVDEGLESQEAINAWEGAYKHYAPLFKDEAEEGMYSHPQGAGFTVKGSASKRAMGSEGEVTNMLAHVFQQREAAITRAEKNRVVQSLYALALENPNPDFFTVVRPNMKDAVIEAELQRMGIDPASIAGMERAPTVNVIDKATGQVRKQVNPMYKNMPNAMVLKVAGQDRVILFNAKNDQALRLVENLRNLDGPTFDMFNHVGHVTRFMASMATQYNPVFGVTNVLRDVQGALVNLSSTPLAGKQLQVMRHIAAAGKGIAADLYKDTEAQGEWSKLYRQFREDGGQTGYMDQVRDPFERTKAIAKELENLDRSKAHPARVGQLVLGALNGWNTSLENAVRLSVYKVALDAGHSRAKAAKMAREIAVDFNRKGANMKYISPLYAFANAAIQGTARTLETLADPKRAAVIVSGGLAIGVLQALALAAQGYDDDEIAEFEKTRALIVPLGVNEEGKKEHLKIPLPLGLHILPNTGRVAAELALSGGKDAGTKVWRGLGEIASAFNPLGGGDITTLHGALTAVAPTVVDPLLDLGMNKNFAGNSISKERFSDSDMRPGHRMAKESTLRQPSGEVYTGIAEAINSVTGGNDYRKGKASPTPEEVRYAIMTVGGGLLREVEKGTNASIKASQGKDIKPNEIPLVGRFFGEVDPDQVTQSRYFNNRSKVEALASEMRQIKKGHGGAAAMKDLRKESPLVNLSAMESATQRRIGSFNTQIIENIDDDAKVQRLEKRRLQAMQQFNARVKQVEAKAQ